MNEKMSYKITIDKPKNLGTSENHIGLFQCNQPYLSYNVHLHEWIILPTHTTESN